MTPILGPVRCSDCGWMVVWAADGPFGSVCWRNAGRASRRGRQAFLRPHECSVARCAHILGQIGERCAKRADHVAPHRSRAALDQTYLLNVGRVRA